MAIPPEVSSGILRVGIELETLLRIGPDETPDLWKALVPKNEKLNNHLFLAKWIKGKYDVWRQRPSKDKWTSIAPLNSTIDMVIDFDDHDKKSDYTKWAITRDHSIKDGSLAYGLEFVSPIIFVGLSKDAWATVDLTVTRFFSFLTDFCKLQLESDATCGTHIHVSPFEWTRDRVERMAFSTFFFEEMVRDLVGEKRAVSIYAKEVRHPDVIKGFRDRTLPFRQEAPIIPHNYGLAWTDLPTLNGDALPWVAIAPAEVIRVLRAIRTDVLNNAQLLELFNPWLSTRSMLRPDQYKWEIDRYYSWNFNNLLFDKNGNVSQVSNPAKGSVEFRRAGQSKTAADALQWVEFVVYFTLSAFRYGTPDALNKYTTYTSDTSRVWGESLYDFLTLPRVPPAPTDAVFARIESRFRGSNFFKLLEDVMKDQQVHPALYNPLRQPTEAEIQQMNFIDGWAAANPDDFTAPLDFLYDDRTQIPPLPVLPQ